MDRKLTLSLNSGVIDRAKRYAKSHGTSLSKLIEHYLSAVVDADSQENNPYTPTVSRLIGIIQLPDEAEDLKAEYADFLNDKYR